MTPKSVLAKVELASRNTKSDTKKLSGSRNRLELVPKFNHTELWLVNRCHVTLNPIVAKMRQNWLIDSASWLVFVYPGDGLNVPLTSLEGTQHHGMGFSTSDHDNDDCPSNCAETFYSCWWFNTCFAANPNGWYFPQGVRSFEGDVDWAGWKGCCTDCLKSQQRPQRKIASIERKRCLQFVCWLVA